MTILSNYTKVEGHINTWIKYYLMSIYCYMSQVLDFLIYLSVFILLIQYFVNFFPLSKYLFCLTGKRTDTTPRNFIKERKNTLYLLCLFYSDNEIITVQQTSNLQSALSLVVHRWIFCQKNLFFPQSVKKLWKTFPIFFTFRSGKFFKFALFWENIVKISIFWGKNYKNFQI